MMVYIITLILGILFTSISVRTKSYADGKTCLPTIIAIFPFFCISAFRYGIGTDYFTYEEIFRRISAANDLQFAFSKWEPIFVVFNKILGTVFKNEIWFFAITSFVFLYLVFFVILDESQNPVLSVYLFYTSTLFFASLNTTREMVAIAILFFSLKYVFSKQWKPYLILAITAGLFHYSCFIFLPVYFLGKLNIRRKHAIILSALFFILRNAIRSVANLLILNSHYAFLTIDGAERGITAYLGLAVQFVIFLFSSFFYSDDRKYRILYNLQMLSLWICILGSSIPLVNRVKWIFFMPFVLLLPAALNNIDNFRIRIYVTLGVIIAFGIYCTIIISGGSFGVLPYMSIF